MSATTEQFIAHFGVRGMKWGFRRDRGSDGHVSGPAHPSGAHQKTGTAEELGLSDDYQTARVASFKARQAGGTHVLSNKELQSLIDRTRLESQFQQAFAKPVPTKQDTIGKALAKKALKSTGEIVANAAKNTAQQMVQQAMKNGADKATKNAAAKAVANAAAREAAKNFIGPKNAGKLKRSYYAQKSKRR